MLHLDIGISNPWWNNRFRHVLDKSFKVSTNKTLEVEIYKHSIILGAGIYISTRKHHAGVSFDIGLLGYTFAVRFCDNRHWDHKNNSWYSNFEDQS
jgi:hypothetical protein